MKIGIDGRLWNESGVGRYIRNLVKGLDGLETKHEFSVFLGAKDYKSVQFKSPNITKIEANSRWHTLSEQLEFKSIVNKAGLDLVHFPYFSYPLFANVPFVITIHDLIIDHYPTGMASSLPFPLYKIKHYAYRHLTKSAVAKSEKIIVPSIATKKELVDHYDALKSKIEVVYEGFDHLISPKKSTQLVTDNYILYVGNAYPHKNVERLINAFEVIAKKSSIDLVCVGRKDFFYERLEKKHPKRVHFLHDVADSALFDYYTNAKLLAMPSLMEGFGLPVLEAMSLSCPVVSSQTEALKEIAGDAALYFDPEQEESIVKNIESVLSKPNVRLEMIRKGKVRAKLFSWRSCVEKTLKVYESCNSIRSSQ